MNIAELLRKLADIVDANQNPAVPDDGIENPAELQTVDTGVAVDAPDNQDAGAEDDVMIPPLQLKMELLKKAVGVDSVYDQGGAREDEVCSSEEDPLAAIRRNAGIESGPMAAIIHGIAGEDEPLDQ